MSPAPTSQARGHIAMPSLDTLGDLSQRALYRLRLDDFDDSLGRQLGHFDSNDKRVVLSFFGRCEDERLDRVARRLFELLPCPILEITFEFRKRWIVSRLRLRSPRTLDPENMAQFAAALEDFSRRVRRSPPKRQRLPYDLAILVDASEKLPPSDTPAIKRFIRAGAELGINCELITQRDYLRLAEYDGLFIRTTTAIDHYTYRFAKRAEAAGLIVIDDCDSILRCTNKVFMAELFGKRGVPTPRTVVMERGSTRQLESAIATLGFPMVVKIPDGSFSRGVEKAGNAAELADICRRLFRRSALLLAQEFLYTDFDWRIGVLEGQALYACRYYMVRRHWQIYRHGSRTLSGGFDSVLLDAVPEGIMKAALSATQAIGNGLYGVDLKERDGQGYVIEVNDNPNVDHGIEDRCSGMEVYRQIMSVFARRMRAMREG